jgi:hypothetical protein
MPEHSGEDHSRESFDRGVVCLNRLVESASLDRNTVFGSFDLRLQIAESGGGPEFRITFGNHQQAR